MSETEISRRDFLRGSAWGAALLGVPAWSVGLDEPPPAIYMSYTTSALSSNWTTPSDLSAVDPAVLVLNRLGFGPRPGDFERVRSMGVDNYVEEQLSPQNIDDSRMDQALKQFPSLTMPVSGLAESYGEVLIQRRAAALMENEGMPMTPQAAIEGFLELFTGGGAMGIGRANALSTPIQIIQATVLRQMLSERQLFEMMVDFWSNHFNIYIFKTQCQFLKTIDDRDVVRKYALGKFRDLLFASAHSPAMMVYLDNVTNVKGVPNENYARELMELHTLSVDGGYAQSDVQDVARCLTGWSVSQPVGGLLGPDYSTAGEFVFHPDRHDAGVKRVLGTSIPSGQGIEDGEQVLDILARHPSTAQFICFKLVRRFVSDNPPAALVSRAADAFSQTDGDIRSVLRTIFHSDEFKQSFGQKVKRPLEYVASAVRAVEPSGSTGAPSIGQGGLRKTMPISNSGAGGVVAQALRLMGQVPFMWQSPNGYPDLAEAWVNSNNLLARWNLALAITENRIPNLHLDLAQGAALTSPEATVDFWTQQILNRTIPDADRAKLVDYLAGDLSGQKIQGLVALIMASPHFQYR